MDQIASFSSQTLANALGTILGGVLLYLGLESRIIYIEKRNETRRLFKNLYGEIIRNIIVLERIKEEEKNLNSNEFPVSRLKVEAMTNFLYARPISKNKDFLYSLNACTANMESINHLIDLVFSVTKVASLVSNKKKVFTMAGEQKIQLNTILARLATLNDQYRFHEKD